ncbi:MAG: hypothetical protein AAF402_02315 [Pseudomonadota bacterium]
MAGWEQFAVGIIALLVALWFFPGIKHMLERSKDAPKDWGGLLLPIGGVILFVFVLISLV